MLPAVIVHFSSRPIVGQGKPGPPDRPTGWPANVEYMFDWQAEGSGAAFYLIQD